MVSIYVAHVHDPVEGDKGNKIINKIASQVPFRNLLEIPDWLCFTLGPIVSDELDDH